VGGNGFINFFLAPVVFHRAITEAAQNPDYGRSTAYAGKKVMVEYTDTNPFKLFHIGHLMSNCIGESLSRLIEWGGAEVKRADYQGDVGLHVAKALWKLVRQPADGDWKLEDGTMTMEMLGRAYAAGATAYESDEQAKKEIHEIREPILKIYEKQGSPYFSTARLWDDGIIDPRKTRSVLGLSLDAVSHGQKSFHGPFGVFRM